MIWSSDCFWYYIQILVTLIAGCDFWDIIGVLILVRPGEIELNLIFWWVFCWFWYPDEYLKIRFFDLGFGLISTKDLIFWFLLDWECSKLWFYLEPMAGKKTVTISADEYARLTKCKPFASTAAFAETGNSSKCLLSSTSKWVIDSGASDHMTGNHHLFSDFHTHSPSSHVTIADGSTPRVLGSGSINLTPSISLSSV